ncbi:MAG: hypothetical protein ABI147_04660 [Acidobacteriaceae bacterium]
MNTSNTTEEQVVNRLALAEKRLRLAMQAILLLILAVAALGGWQTWAIHRLAHPQKLTLHRLDIVDDHGVARVILAAPVPEPMVLGWQHHRDGPVSGVIIADGTGTERGGHVTSDGDLPNALLTLDAEGRQTVLLLAEPGGSTLFRIWNGDVGSLTMGVDNNPFLNMHQRGSLTFSTPQDNPQSRDARTLFR